MLLKLKQAFPTPLLVISPINDYFCKNYNRVKGYSEYRM